MLAFRHDLVRATAYEGLSFRRRRDIHGRVGIALEAAARSAGRRGGGAPLAPLLRGRRQPASLALRRARRRSCDGRVSRTSARRSCTSARSPRPTHLDDLPPGGGRSRERGARRRLRAIRQPTTEATLRTTRARRACRRRGRGPARRQARHSCSSTLSRYDDALAAYDDALALIEGTHEDDGTPARELAVGARRRALPAGPLRRGDRRG